MKKPIKIFLDPTPKKWLTQKFRPPQKFKLTQKILTHLKKFDPHKNIFDPPNPRKNYDSRENVDPLKRYFDPRNPRNPRKKLTHLTLAPTQSTHPRNPRYHATHTI